MQTSIHTDLKDMLQVREADDILRSCVHCGFCTATCPTYQITGDELDGPRGRIYLIKNLLEENVIDQKPLAHLDRCLTCRSCETTCPSGVQYGRLLDIARELPATRVNRPVTQDLISHLIRFVVPRPGIFLPLLRLGQFLKPVLPAFLAEKSTGSKGITACESRQSCKARHSVTGVCSAGSNTQCQSRDYDIAGSTEYCSGIPGIRRLLRCSGLSSFRAQNREATNAQVDRSALPPAR